MGKRIFSYNIDCDRLQKGDVIPVTQLEAIIGYEYGTDSYRTGLLNLKSYIERRLYSRKYYCTLAVRRGQLCILTDVEASTYRNDMQASGIRRVARSHQGLAWVEEDNLSQDERAKHRTRLLNSSSVVQALAVPVRKITNPDNSKTNEPACKMLMGYSTRFI